MDTHGLFMPDRLEPAADNRGRPPTVFQEDWWLDAASGGRVERVEVHWDAICVASLNFVSHLGFRTVRSLVMPPYTRTLGPVLNLPASRPTQHALNTQRVIRELRAKLPPHDRFMQQLDPADDTAFAFSLAGFSVAQAFTFRVEPHQDRELLMAGMDPATRRLVRAGARSLSVEQHEDVERFIRLALRDRGPEENIHDFAALRRLFTASFARGQGTFLTVLDATGQDLASVFLVWNHRTAFYVVPVRDRQASTGGTNAFLLWSSLCFAGDRGLCFDFDSYATVGTARFLSSFGLKPLARPVVSYQSTRARVVDLGRHLLSRCRAAGDMDGLVSLRNARPSARDRAAVQRSTEG